MDPNISSGTLKIGSEWDFSIALIAGITCTISADGEVQLGQNVSWARVSPEWPAEDEDAHCAQKESDGEAKLELFFSIKKKQAKRDEWRNPTTEEKEKIVQELEEYIVID